MEGAVPFSFLVVSTVIQPLEELKDVLPRPRLVLPIPK